MFFQVKLINFSLVQFFSYLFFFDSFSFSDEEDEDGELWAFSVLL